MSARDVMTARITAAFGPTLGQSIPSAIEDALTAASYRIVGPDEVDPVTGASIPRSVSDADLSQWAEKRADDAGRLARELVAYRRASLPQDVINLVTTALEHASFALDGVVALDDEDKGKDGGSETCQHTKRTVDRALASLRALLDKEQR